MLMDIIETEAKILNEKDVKESKTETNTAMDSEKNIIKEG